MPVTPDLIALGTPAELAMLQGFNGNGRAMQEVTGVGTAQAGAALIRKKNTWAMLITAGGATACVLPSDAELMVPYWICVESATTGLVFPSTGMRINAAAANASVSIATQLARVFYRCTATHWLSFLAA
jgi:hypothetical protein